MFVLGYILYVKKSHIERQECIQRVGSLSIQYLFFAPTTTCTHERFLINSTRMQCQLLGTLAFCLVPSDLIPADVPSLLSDGHIAHHRGEGSEGERTYTVVCLSHMESVLPSPSEIHDF